MTATTKNKTLTAGQRITAKVREQIHDMADVVNGRRRTRILHEDDIEEFISLLRKYRSDDTVYIIRVYSSDGFVANSYPGRAEISRLTARWREDGAWIIEADVASANGRNRPTTLVNNRAHT